MCVALHWSAAGNKHAQKTHTRAHRTPPAALYAGEFKRFDASGRAGLFFAHDRAAGVRGACERMLCVSALHVSCELIWVNKQPTINCRLRPVCVRTWEAPCGCAYVCVRACECVFLGVVPFARMSGRTMCEMAPRRVRPMTDVMQSLNN